MVLKSILIIDDSNISRRILIKAVQDLGADPADILTAATVDDAMAQWKIFDQVNGIVFLDIVLPGHGGGLDLLEQFKKDCPGSRIIIQSSRTDKESILRARDLGASYYLIKPFSIEKLKVVLEKLS